MYMYIYVYSLQEEGASYTCFVPVKRLPHSGETTGHNELEHMNAVALTEFKNQITSPRSSGEQSLSFVVGLGFRV